jgi:hypothetical protein
MLSDFVSIIELFKDSTKTYPTAASPKEATNSFASSFEIVDAILSLSEITAFLAN